MKKDDLGKRMKEYEKVMEQKLMKKVPVIVRIDGKAFHTYTRGMKKPFDDVLMEAMQETTKKLCEQIMGARIGYTQSDEITIVLINDKKESTESWFDNKVQKIVSISASIATFEFNKLMYEKTGKIALFDSRAFTVPTKVEAGNNLYWRELDARRNSVQMLAQSLYSHKELQNISAKDLIQKMKAEQNIDWEKLESSKKNGTVVKKVNNKWSIEKEIPIFTEDWSYILEELN